MQALAALRARCPSKPKTQVAYFSSYHYTPYSIEQGIISAEQGILFQEQGIFPVKSEINIG